MEHHAFFSYFLLLCLATLISCTGKNEQKPPNVILIMADDMGAETLGCFGHKYNQTPHLDAMASSGILFKNCISQPLCTPSRVKIMTGLYNYRNYEYFGYLNSNQYTFGNLFSDQGYATCIAGKWQLNGLAYKNEIADWNNPSRPIQFGFQEYCLWQLTKSRGEGERYADPLLEQNGEVLSRNKDDYGPDIFCDFILDFIQRKKDQPFFVYYPMVLVHDPFVPTPDSKAWKEDSIRYKNDTTYFKDMVEYTDKIVGKIITQLQDLEIEEETLIIFTGDNGTHPSIFSTTQTGIIQGAKGNTISAGVHVPLIMQWGDQIKAPFTYEGLIEFSDFFATFADLLNVEAESDGKSFLNLLEGEKEYSPRETAFVHYDPRWGKNVNKYRNQFVQTDAFKLYQDGRFFHISSDRLEQNNLSEEALPQKEGSIKRKLEKELLNHPKWKEQKEESN